MNHVVYVQGEPVRASDIAPNPICEHLVQCGSCDNDECYRLAPPGDSYCRSPRCGGHPAGFHCFGRQARTSNLSVEAWREAHGYGGGRRGAPSAYPGSRYQPEYGGTPHAQRQHPAGAASTQRTSDDLTVEELGSDNDEPVHDWRPAAEDGAEGAEGAGAREGNTGTDRSRTLSPTQTKDTEEEARSDNRDEGAGAPRGDRHAHPRDGPMPRGAYEMPRGGYGMPRGRAQMPHRRGIGSGAG